MSNTELMLILMVKKTTKTLKIKSVLELENSFLL